MKNPHYTHLPSKKANKRRTLVKWPDFVNNYFQLRLTQRSPIPNDILPSLLQEGFSRDLPCTGIAGNETYTTGNPRKRAGSIWQLDDASDLPGGVRLPGEHEHGLIVSMNWCTRTDEWSPCALHFIDLNRPVVANRDFRG